MQRLRSTLTTTAVAALTSVALVGVSPPASAATSTRTQAGATWLAGELTGGVLHNPLYDYDDWGLTVDALLAFRAAGNQPGAVTAVKSALVGGGLQEYVVPGFGTLLSAGAIAKTTVAVEASGSNPRSFGGRNLLADLRGRVTVSGARTGRVADKIETGSADYANTIVQAYAVAGLAAGGTPSATATSFLVKQQCTAGYFRLSNNDGKTCTTGGGTADVDATALALEALISARQDGASTLGTPIAKATSWLVSAQRADGSYGGAGPTSAPNANSTGLAAQALAAAGRTTDAAQAVAWLKKLQVIAATGGALASEVGAIAYNRDGFKLGVTEGITDQTSDQWRRASAQAILGLSGRSLGSLLPAPARQTARVSATQGYVKGGTTFAVRVSGLAERETYTVSISGRVVKTSIASSTGTGSVRATAPATTGRRTVSVRGLTSGRTGSTSVSVLGAKVLKPRLAKSEVTRRHYQKVRVKHLASGEAVRVRYRGDRISPKSAHANGNGVYRLRFKVGKSLGKKTVKVRGEFRNRHGEKSFRVVR